MFPCWFNACLLPQVTPLQVTATSERTLVLWSGLYIPMSRLPLVPLARTRDPLPVTGSLFFLRYGDTYLFPAYIQGVCTYVLRTRKGGTRLTSNGNCIQAILTHI